MLFSIASALSRLPIGVHYALADGILYPFLYYVMRYRRTIVGKNLLASFPDKTDKERKAIERAFYHQFCDTIAEIIYGLRFSAEEMRERAVFENMDEVNRLVDKAGGGIFMLAHMGNWEWLASVQQWVSPGVTELNVYRRQTSAAADRLMLSIRKRHGGECVEKQRILREMIRYKREDKPVTIGLISDQKPRPEVTRIWVPFLHQETGFLDGGEVLGKKFGYPVFYAYITRPSRGKYHISMRTIAATPQSCAEGEITKAYARMLEENICAEPQLWLWSHNRWKWKREKSL